MLLATNKDQSTVAKNYVLAPLESQRSPVLVGLGGLGKSVAPPQAEHGVAGREDLPIVVLSSRGDETAKVEALDLGADRC